jgi:hypothetical protein
MLAPGRRGETVTLDEVMCVVSDLEGQALTATEDGWLREDLADMREKVRAAIESYARSQRRAALEEAAKMCEQVTKETISIPFKEKPMECAARIRGLIGKEETT